MTAVERQNAAIGPVVWNLFARFRGDQCVDVVMPDDAGELATEAPIGDEWYAVRWPVNPHFTGRSLILDMLTDRFQHRTPY